MVTGDMSQNGCVFGMGGTASRAFVDAWGVPVVLGNTPARSKSKRTAPAASRAEESADNSDDLEAVEQGSHEDGADTIRAVGEGKGKFLARQLRHSFSPAVGSPGRNDLF